MIDHIFCWHTIMTLLIDFIGSLVSLSCTALLVRLNPLGWPMGLIANTINIYLLYQSQLYSNCGLEAYFFCSTLYGWYFWLQQDETKPIDESIKTLQGSAWMYIITAISLITLLLYYGLSWTDSTTPGLDSITTAISIVAQLLLARRYLENWYLWFVTDAIYVVLYSSKGLPFHAVMMMIFLGLALDGARRWSRLMHRAANPIGISNQMHDARA